MRTIHWLPKIFRISRIFSDDDDDDISGCDVCGGFDNDSGDDGDAEFFADGDAETSSFCRRFGAKDVNGANAVDVASYENAYGAYGF